MSIKKLKTKIAKLIAMNDITIEHPDFGIKFDEKMKKQEDLINELKADAKALGTILGRTVRFQMADSYALYIITKVTKNTATLTWLDWCDAWQDDRIGYEGKVDFEYALRQVTGEDKLNELFSKRN